MTHTNTELHEIKEIIEVNGQFHVFTANDAVELAEALEEIYVNVMVTTTECEGVWTLVSSTVTSITIEFGDEEGDLIEVVLNTYTHDTTGKELSYDSKTLKSFKTQKGAENFASKMGLTISYI